MNVSTCVNCHQPVASTDEICENCGAVLPPLSATVPPIHTTNTTTFPAIPTSINANSASICPNCKQPISPVDEICENCGVVFASFVTPIVVATTSTPTQETCPQCHAPRTSGVKFCNQCGYRYETSTSPAASSVISQPNMPEQTTQLAPGSILNGKYSIVKEIGAGGMGAVYLADDQILKRRVVIKALLSEDDPDLVAQSVKERDRDRTHQAGHRLHRLHLARGCRRGSYSSL